MPSEMSPKKMMDAIQRGRKRLHNFRSARLMFLRNYVGAYYDKEQGAVGAEPLNLIFNAIRILLPNIVMNFPKHNVESRFLGSKDYADLLSLGLSYQDKVMDVTSLYRRVVTDACFAMGIAKTALGESDSLLAIDEYSRIDVGEVYTSAVDFDNFLADPDSREHLFADAAWLGDRCTVSRLKMLESGLYDNALIERLPSIGDQYRRNRASGLSMRNINPRDNFDFDDQVEIAEIWVPNANAVLTVPGGEDFTTDRYLRVDDHYGPHTGPYTMLSLTPPVPGNPVPVPMVGIWNDLHVLANRMARKIVDQAERQKDVVAYQRSAADDASELQQAADGEAVATDNPDGVKVLSFGGQQQSNEIHLAQLQSWFNMMAANPQGVGGQSLDADSATEAQILSQNANIGLEDMKDLVYQFAAAEARKRAWFLHTDPFINLPLIRRQQQPAQYEVTPNGPVMVAPPQAIDQQVFLTPEARRGDWLDFTFSIEPESMGRMDSGQRFRQAMDFAVKVLPAAAQAVQAMAMMGIPFNVKAYIVRMANSLGIDWMDEVFYDPDFQLRMMQMMMAGPSPAGSQGQPGEQAPRMPKPLMAALLQNGQPGQVAGGVPDDGELMRQQQQSGAADSQSQLKQLY